MLVQVQKELEEERRQAKEQQRQAQEAIEAKVAELKAIEATRCQEVRAHSCNVWDYVCDQHVLGVAKHLVSMCTRVFSAMTVCRETPAAGPESDRGVKWHFRDLNAPFLAGV